LELPGSNGTSGGITWDDGKGNLNPNYDRDAARAQLSALLKEDLVAGPGSLLFNDTQLIAEQLCTHEDKHDDHIHVQITPPPMKSRDTYRQM
jgi:hypothetical protein